ncbi:MAG: ABC transporter ATP-binding protein [Anaerolineae bacterium]
MSDVAITVENLGKEYRIGTRERHDTLRDAVAGAFRRSRAPASAASASGRSDVETLRRSDGEAFWALKDVSFTVRRGEVVGVIGRNGAGKSTLLKILSRITEPTTGRAVIHGRVGSLLEVGTGFHPELTGRENIYLNGAILGMRRTEIDRRFDEIVAFSEIERFLDTPVKRYSSGMYVRLAFAVAAHLDPEVLIVDEVLAVGDAAFQKKCLGKMGDVAGEGRTVLFVSHNMAAVQNLCQRTMVLRDGEVALLADSSTAIGEYLSRYRGVGSGIFDSSRAVTTGGTRARITDCQIASGMPETGQPFALEIVVERPAGVPAMLGELSVTFSTVQGAHVLQAYSAHMGNGLVFRDGITRVRMELASLQLVPDDYWVDLWLGVGDTPVHWLRECLSVTVGHGSICGDRAVDNRGFPVVVRSRWSGTEVVRL